MKKIQLYLLIFYFGTIQLFGQGTKITLTGLMNEEQTKMVLVGYNGKQEYVLDSSEIDSAGRVEFQIPRSYKGFGTVQKVGKQGQMPLLLLGDCTTIQNVSINSGQLIFSEGSPNEVYNSLKRKSTQSKSQLDLLNQLSKYYDPTSVFAQAIVTEKKKVTVAEQKFVKEINSLTTDVGYFLRVEESLYMMNTLLSGTEQLPIEKLKATQVYFEKVVNFQDERLWHTGFVHRLIYSYYSLSTVLEGGHQHAGDFLATQLARSPYKNTYLEEIIGVVQGQPAIAEYFSQKMLAASGQCDDIQGNDMPGRIKRQLEQYSLLKIGNVAPDERLDNGKRISELAGSNKLIVFWASWCEHCQKEIPELRAMYADLKKQDVEVVAMGMDDNAQIHGIVSQVNPWVSHFVGRDWNAPVTQHYRVFGTPTYFLVDKDMKIIARPKSAAEVAQWINRNKI